MSKHTPGPLDDEPQITVEMTLPQLDIVRRSLQHTATAILAARDSHLLTQAEASKKHRETWEVYCIVSDQYEYDKFMQDAVEMG